MELDEEKTRHDISKLFPPPPSSLIQSNSTILEKPTSEKVLMKPARVLQQKRERPSLQAGEKKNITHEEETPSTPPQTKKAELSLSQYTALEKKNNYLPTKFHTSLYQKKLNEEDIFRECRLSDYIVRTYVYCIYL